MILGIDVGGTHTDAVLIDRLAVKKKAKVLTDENNLRASLLAVTTEIIDEESVGKLKKVVLSTTLSTNAIVQNRIDRVGMMLISGPGLPASLINVPPDTFFLSGYINHRGIEISAIDPLEATGIGEHFRANGIKQVGIVGKFSTRNPRQETEIRELSPLVIPSPAI
jgi:N-methylhydantoinase A